MFPGFYFFSFDVVTSTGKRRDLGRKFAPPGENNKLPCQFRMQLEEAGVIPAKGARAVSGAVKLAMPTFINRGVDSSYFDFHSISGCYRPFPEFL